MNEDLIYLSTSSGVMCSRDFSCCYFQQAIFDSCFECCGPFLSNFFEGKTFSLSKAYCLSKFINDSSLFQLFCLATDSYLTKFLPSFFSIRSPTSLVSSSNQLLLILISPPLLLFLTKELLQLKSLIYFQIEFLFFFKVGIIIYLDQLYSRVLLLGLSRVRYLCYSGVFKGSEISSIIRLFYCWLYNSI